MNLFLIVFKPSCFTSPTSLPVGISPLDLSVFVYVISACGFAVAVPYVHTHATLSLVSSLVHFAIHLLQEVGLLVPPASRGLLRFQKRSPLAVPILQLLSDKTKQIGLGIKALVSG